MAAGFRSRGCDRKAVGPVVDAESGLIYMRARFLDPSTGQWLTRDPIVDATRQAYSYANDNPLNNVDPSGLIGFQIGPVKVGDGCPLGKNPNGSCRGSNIKNDLTYTAIGLGGAALVIGTAGAAAPALGLVGAEGLTVLGVSAGTASVALGAGSTAASVGVAYIDCRRDLWLANCAASSAEALGGGVPTYFGGATVTLGRPGLRVASGFLGFIFDLAALRSPEGC
jgi:RHS repeat-associated protein